MGRLVHRIPDGGETLKVLELNDQEMYKIVERDDGTVELDVLLGGSAMYEMHIPFTDEELARYREEGQSFLRWFIDRVRHEPWEYKR
jgi:hypothetical protein